MSLIYYGYSDNLYTNLYLSGKGYPAGTKIRGIIDLTVNPEAGTYGWDGPFHALGTNSTKTITILDPIEVNYGQALFYDLKKVTTIKGLDNLYGGLIKCDRMFAGLTSLYKILDSNGDPAPFELKNLTFGACVSTDSMFEDLPLTGAFDMSNFDTRNIVSAGKMFKGAKFSSINMQTCDTFTFRETTEMFANCPNLVQILATEGHWDMSQVLTSTDMFTGSTGLPNYPGGLDKTGAVPMANGGHIDIQVAPQIIARTHINLRYDTLANWELYNPVLMKGEVAIDSTTKRIKVGNGVSNFKDLPYYDSYNPDNISTGQTSEGEMYVITDNKTVFIGPDGLYAKQAEVDSETVFFDADGKISLHIDKKTIVLDANGDLSALPCVAADGITIIDTNGEFSVPIDNDTIYVDGGVIKSKGLIAAGKGIDYNATTGEVDIRLDDKTIVLQGDSTTSGYISVQYDGKSIFWNDTALSGHYAEAGDGITVTDSTTGDGTKQTISANVDNDTIKIDGGKLAVNIDGQTIKVDGGVLTAPGKVSDVKLNGTSLLDADGVADIPVGDGTLGVVKVDGNGLEIDASGTISIKKASDADIEGRTGTDPITPENLDKAVKEGLLNNSIPLTDAEKEKMQGWLDIKQAVDEVTIVRNANDELTVNIDEETIQVKDGKLIATGKVEAGKALTATVDADHVTTLDVNVDNMTVRIDEYNRLETGVDNKYIIKSPFGITVPFDETIFKVDGGKVKIDTVTMAEFDAFWEGLL